MPRKQTGTLLWYKSGWFGRYWGNGPDGKRERLFVDLETKNQALARQRLDVLIAKAEGELSDRSGPETFAEAAERVHELRIRTIPSARSELSYMRKHVNPAIGTMLVTEVTKDDVLAVLEATRAAGLSQQTILHVRNAIGAVYRQLLRERIVQATPLPSTDELPEADHVDERPKAVLSDDELLVYLDYTDPRPGERFRAGVRERQLMALFSRCVGGMRTGELHGLTWARARADGGAFDALEVVRFKTRRKASRRGSKAVARQLFPLGDTVLPNFLRYWHARTTLRMRGVAPSIDAPLFPIRRARSSESDRTGQVRAGSSTWASALRRDVAAAFKSAHDRKVPGVPAEGSQRWRELFEGTEDRRQLWFHNSRNMAAIAAERVERLRSASRFTAHASARMLQHYREMAGEIDVVPVVPELMPDQDTLLAILRRWCIADEVPTHLVFTDEEAPREALVTQNELAHGSVTRVDSTPFTAVQHSGSDLKSAVFLPVVSDSERLGSDCSIQLSYGSGCLRLATYNIEAASLHLAVNTQP